MSLISSPVKIWEEIRLKDERVVLTVPVYLMVGLCGLPISVGALWTSRWGGPQNFQLAMTQCCIVAVALSEDYSLTAYIINQMRTEVLGMFSGIPLAQQSTDYTLAVTFLLCIVTGLLPDPSIAGWLLQLYITYVVQEGVRVVMLMEEKNRLCYTIFSSVLLILCPAVI